MTAVIAAITGALPQSFSLLLTDITPKVTLLLALTVLIVVLSRRASAAWRHLVWMLGLTAALGLPLLTGALPHLTVVLPQTLPALSVPVPVRPLLPSAGLPPQRAESAAPLGAAGTTRFVPQTAAGQTAGASSTGAFARAVPITLLLVWLVGMGAVLTQWLAGGAGLRKILKATVAVQAEGPGSVAAMYRAADSALSGGHRPVSLRVATTTEAVRTPLTWGWRQPVIVLPLGAETWPEEQLRAALLHEMAHVRRRDWPLQRLAHLICALFWFHPLVWVAARAARAESEKASDDLVLSAGLPAAAYASHLLAAARSLHPCPRGTGYSAGQGAVAIPACAEKQNGHDLECHYLANHPYSRTYNNTKKLIRCFSSHGFTPRSLTSLKRFSNPTYSPQT